MELGFPPVFVMESMDGCNGCGRGGIAPPKEEDDEANEDDRKLPPSLDKNRISVSLGLVSAFLRIHFRHGQVLIIIVVAGCLT